MSIVSAFRTKCLCALLVLLSGFAVVPAQAQDYDEVILNGRMTT
jgi:hypothetical protein